MIPFSTGTRQKNPPPLWTQNYVTTRFHKEESGKGLRTTAKVSHLSDWTGECFFSHHSLITSSNTYVPLVHFIFLLSTPIAGIQRCHHQKGSNRLVNVAHMISVTFQNREDGSQDLVHVT